MTPEEAKQKYEEILAGLSPELREVFLRLQAEAKPRPKLECLSASTLNSLESEDLDTAIVDYVERQISQSEDRHARLFELPRGLQVFYLSFLVEAEVMNGGFNQFFWNSSGEFAEAVAPALRQLGAGEAAEIFERAFAVAKIEAEKATLNPAPRTLEAFSTSYETTQLNGFDVAFCEHALHFPSLRLHLARHHTASLCDDG